MNPSQCDYKPWTIMSIFEVRAAAAIGAAVAAAKGVFCSAIMLLKALCIVTIHLGQSHILLKPERHSNCTVKH